VDKVARGLSDDDTESRSPYHDAASTEVVIHLGMVACLASVRSVGRSSSIAVTTIYRCRYIRRNNTAKRRLASDRVEVIRSPSPAGNAAAALPFPRDKRDLRTRGLVDPSRTIVKPYRGGLTDDLMQDDGYRSP
jgi:hypothetical protein